MIFKSTSHVEIWTIPKPVVDTSMRWHKRIIGRWDIRKAFVWGLRLKIMKFDNIVSLLFLPFFSFFKNVISFKKLFHHLIEGKWMLYVWWRSEHCINWICWKDGSEKPTATVYVVATKHGQDRITRVRVLDLGRFAILVHALFNHRLLTHRYIHINRISRYVKVLR